jgi:hypothetical protein
MYFTIDPAPQRARALPLYKTLLCFACVLILVVNGYFLLRNLDGLKAANTLQDRTAQVTDELQHLNLLVTDAESNLRGYFLSGSELYLGSVQTAPGLKFRLPWPIHKVTHYSKRLLLPEMLSDHLPDRVLALLERAAQDPPS